MNEEIITIWKGNIDTGEAVKNIGDLQENVKVLKEYLKTLDVGTQEYQETLSELKVNQNALKDAMYATSSSMEDVSQAAQGAGESYNALVHRMAALKEEFRATNDVANRMVIGKQINEINNQLKEMDALQGNFQRNVGNYQSAFKGLAGQIDGLDKALKVTSGGLGGVKNGFDALSASPAVATFGILVSLALKLADSLKDNETATAGFKKGMDALKPVMNFIAGITDKLVNALVDIIGKVTEFVTSNGLFNKIINGVVGVGNAILQYVISPFKGVVEAIKVFQEKGIKGLGEAAKAFGQEVKNGVSFKQNFKNGQTIADTIIKGASSKKKEAQDAGKDIGKEVGKGIEDGLKLADWKKALAEADRKLDAIRKYREQLQKEIDDYVKDETEETYNYVAGILAEIDNLQAESLANAEANAQARVNTMYAVASGVSGILGSIADMYENDEENAEKNAEKIKAIRIASATIDTISGAIGAYMQSVATIPPPYGIITGAIQAAAVTAAGIAQIANIKKTSISSSGGSTSSSAMSSAPAVVSNITNVRNVTSSSEETRLNKMASDQKVYILSSDIEASNNQRKVQVAESSF